MLRLPAFIIDYIIVIIGLMILSMMFFPSYLASLQPKFDPASANYQQMMQQATENMVKHRTEFILIQLGIFLVTVLYNTACESSRLRASVGKYVMGLAVVDELGYSLTYLHALKRNAGKIVYEAASLAIGFLAYVAYFRMIWSDKHQAFHDMFSGCYIVKKNG